MDEDDVNWRALRNTSKRESFLPYEPVIMDACSDTILRSMRPLLFTFPAMTYLPDTTRLAFHHLVLRSIKQNFFNHCTLILTFSLARTKLNNASREWKRRVERAKRKVKRKIKKNQTVRRKRKRRRVRMIHNSWKTSLPSTISSSTWSTVSFVATLCSRKRWKTPL